MSSSLLIEEAKRHLLWASTLGQPDWGTRWGPMVEGIRRDIASFNTADDCLNYAQHRITYDSRDFSLPALEDLVKEDFPEFQSSDIFPFHAHIVHSAVKHTDAHRHIIEIGGGYGEPCRAWLALASVESYVIIDIPESLFFAEVALRARFGDRVGYFDGADPGTDILLVPAMLLEQINRPCDLVTNTGSMQEMTDSWIDKYMEWLRNYPAKFFYSLNYIYQNVWDMGESRSLWSPRPGPEWGTRHLRVDIPLLKYMGPNRDFLEIVYEKGRAPEPWSAPQADSLLSYARSLDRLRQNFTETNAREFVDAMPDKKEVLYVAEKIGHERAPALRARLGGYIEHRP